jgi:GDP-D-mannose dehydratase
VVPPRLSHLAGRIEIAEGNLQDAGALRIIATRVQPRYVFHLGAYTHVGKSFDHVGESLQTNIAGTVNLLEALRGLDYATFVYTGTSEIYGGNPVPFREDQPVSPLSPYSSASTRESATAACSTRRTAGPSSCSAPSTPTVHGRAPTASCRR